MTKMNFYFLSTCIKMDMTIYLLTLVILIALYLLTIDIAKPIQNGVDKKELLTFIKYNKGDFCKPWNKRLEKRLYSREQNYPCYPSLYSYYIKTDVWLDQDLSLLECYEGHKSELYKLIDNVDCYPYDITILKCSIIISIIVILLIIICNV